MSGGEQIQPFSDRDFDDYYRQLIAFKERFGHCRVLNWPEYRELAAWLQYQRHQWDHLTLDELEKLFNLGVRFGYRPDQWIAQMMDLKAFHAKYGHVHITQSDPVHGGLGKWCSKKRGQREKLSPGQIRLMGELGFIWDPLQVRYLERLKKLREFQRQYGHCDVPSGHPEFSALASWIHHVRVSDTLPDWVRRELDKMGFSFQPVLERQWEERFAEAKNFYETHGHLLAPQGSELLTWLSEQRNRPTPLPEERRQRLETIGFDWNPRETAWNQQFARLERFHRAHGHCNVPIRYPEDPPLGAWVNQTRKNADKLSPERRQRLEALGFIWRLQWPDEYRPWKYWYEKLVEFQRQHGHCRVSEYSGPDIPLGRWVVRQRAIRAEISEHRKQLLDAIGFSWTPFETAWMQKFHELTAFKARYGHCNVTMADPEHASLRVWLVNQRKKYHAGQLRHERERLLSELGLVWNMAEEQWRQRLEELRAFKHRFGHCNVPALWKENPELGRWVSRMRSRKNRQSAERIKALDALGFEWTASFRSKKRSG